MTQEVGAGQTCGSCEFHVGNDSAVHYGCVVCSLTPENITLGLRPLTLRTTYVDLPQVEPGGKHRIVEVEPIRGITSMVFRGIYPTNYVRDNAPCTLFEVTGNGRLKPLYCPSNPIN